MKNNAILLCGGVGRRMSPFPLCNKSLLPIRGEVNLHRIIRVLGKKGIGDIVIATNPLFKEEIKNYIRSCEEFSLLRIKIVSASDYTEGCNNVVTLKAVSNYIRNSYILETDQYYYEELLDFLQPEPLPYSAVFTHRRTEEDWGVVSRQGRVIELKKNNPGNLLNCLSGFYYIGRSDSYSLRSSLNLCADREIYWEEMIDLRYIDLREIVCGVYSEEYDSIHDLVENKMMTSLEIADLVDDDHSAVLIGGMTNKTYKVKKDGKFYALRVPGYGTSKFINHYREMYIESTIPDTIRPKSYYYSDGTVKLSEFLEDYCVLSSIEDFRYVLPKLSRVHEKVPKGESPYHINLESEILDYESLYSKDSGSYIEYEKYRALVLDFLNGWFLQNPYYKVHRDLVPLNIMINKDKDVKFIDWEYTGYLSPLWDLASFSCEFSSEYEVALESVVSEVLKWYPVPVKELDLYRWIVVVDFVWAAWSLAKISLGDDVREYGLCRYERCRSLAKKYFE